MTCTISTTRAPPGHPAYQIEGSELRNCTRDQSKLGSQCDSDQPARFPGRSCTSDWSATQHGLVDRRAVNGGTVASRRWHRPTSAWTQASLAHARFGTSAHYRCKRDAASHHHGLVGLERQVPFAGIIPHPQQPQGSRRGDVEPNKTNEACTTQNDI